MENKLSKESTINIVKSRTFITTPGKYHVQVENDPEALAHSGAVLRELESGGHICSILNLKAFTPFHKSQFQAFMQEGEFDKAANQQLTVSVRTKDYMPQKGEVIAINVGYAKTKDGEEGLFVNSYTALPVSTGGKLSADDLFSTDVEDGVELVVAEDANESAQQF